MSAIWVRGVIVVAVVVGLVGCTGGNCNAPLREDLVGAVTSIDSVTGVVVESRPTSYLGRVDVRAQRLVHPERDGTLLDLAAATGPRRQVVTSIRTFGPRLFRVDDRGMQLWRQEGAGGRVLGVSGTVLVVEGFDGQLRGLDFATGRLLWNLRLDHRLLVTDSRLLGTDVVAVGGRAQDALIASPMVASVAAATGKPRWVADMQAGLPELLTATDKVVVATVGERGTGTERRTDLHAFVRGDGRQAWVRSLPVGQGLRALDLDGGRVVAVTSQDTFGCE